VNTMDSSTTEKGIVCLSQYLYIKVYMCFNKIKATTGIVGLTTLVVKGQFFRLDKVVTE